MLTCFCIRQYKNTLDLVFANEKDGPQLFQINYGDKESLTELIDFTTALMICQQRGDTLVSYDSLRFGMRYITDNSPAKLDSIGLALGHIDLLFWAQSTLTYEFKPLEAMQKYLQQPEDIFGTLNIVQWLSEVMAGKADFGHYTWVKGLDTVAVETHWRKLDPTTAPTVGALLVDYVEQKKIEEDQDFATEKKRLQLFYPFIAWIFAYEAELTDWLKGKPRNEKKSVHDD